MTTEKQANERSSDDLSAGNGSDARLRPDAPRRPALLSRAQVLALLGPLLISLEGVDPVVASAADLYNLGVHDVARALLALPDDARSPLEESD